MTKMTKKYSVLKNRLTRCYMYIPVSAFCRVTENPVIPVIGRDRWLSNPPRPCSYVSRA